MVIQDTIDSRAPSGYHDFEGVPRSVILAQGQQTSVTMSHEACEMTADPNADKWVPLPDGGDVALEVCDPCESDTYAKLVTIMGADRYVVVVSNFVLPSWFQPAGRGPFDRLGTIAQALELAPGATRSSRGQTARSRTFGPAKRLGRRGGWPRSRIRPRAATGGGCGYDGRRRGPAARRRRPGGRRASGLRLAAACSRRGRHEGVGRRRVRAVLPARPRRAGTTAGGGRGGGGDCRRGPGRYQRRRATAPHLPGVR
jgi:hypothetical protein